MTLPLHFHPAVRGEINDAHDWYERRQHGLGGDFLDAVQRALAAVVANLALYGFADGNIRECPLSRFPYAIYYRELPNRIRVLAVYHLSRDPSGWQVRV